MDFNNTNYCLVPFSFIKIRPNGDVGYCGRLHNIFGNIFNNNLTDILQNNKIKSLRHAFLNNDKHDICKHCWETEGAMGRSHRHIISEHYSSIFNITEIQNDFNLKHLQISPSNLCNLACKMCGAHDSTSYLSMLNHPSDYVFKYKNYKTEQLFKILSNTILEHSSELQMLSILGGEPTIEYKIKEYFFDDDKILNIIKNLKIVAITTNLSMKNEKNNILKLFLGLNNLRLNVSIDGVYGVMEYIRTNILFEDFDNNIKSVVKNGNKFGTMLSFQALNALNIVEIFNYMLIFQDNLISIDGSNKVFNDHLRASILPKELKDKAIYRLEHELPKTIERFKNQKFRNSINNYAKIMIDELSKPQIPEDWEKFKAFIKEFDEKSNMDIKDYIPEIAAYL